GSLRVSGPKALYRMSAQSAQSEVLDQFAAGTGGTYFHNRNDLDEGLRQAVAAPPVSYVLGFSPQNLKLNGAYHTFKISLANRKSASRRGVDNLLRARRRIRQKPQSRKFRKRFSLRRKSKTYPWTCKLSSSSLMPRRQNFPLWLI